MENEMKLYSIGEICERTNLTIRTLRYYHSIGLLEPTEVINGRRYYDLECLKVLQQISTLKYIGLNLSEIKETLNGEKKQSITEFKYSLIAQRNMLKEKIKHMSCVERALTNSIDAIDDDIFKDNELIDVIGVINQEKDWNEQYKNATSLNARIKIHDLYSTAEEGWFQWYFKDLVEKNGEGNLKVLEIASGQGDFWKKNKKFIPENWDITLSDISQGMLEECKNNLQSMGRKFKYKIIDCENIELESESYDLIIGNHFLYHVQDIERALREINRVLKKGGYFFTSTIGENHLSGMEEITKEFNKDIELFSMKHYDKFGLQNGEKTLKKTFKVLERKIHEDSLIIKEGNTLVGYILSFPFKGRQIIEEKIGDFRGFINNKLISEPIVILKETGYFVCMK